MTFKEWHAAVMLAGAAVMSGWVAVEVVQPGALERSVAEISTRLIWVIGYAVAFNIVAMIVVAILVGIVRREELRDEPADERDRLVDARAMRNGYLALSVAGAGCLLALALGLEPGLGAYALFAALMASGAVHAASQLVYYRLG